MPALAKASYEICYRTGIDYAFVAGRHPVALMYEAMQFDDVLQGELKSLVDEKAKVLEAWMDQGRINRTDPYHLIFSIWATTQHYADFDVQVRAVLGPQRGGEGRFEDAARYLEQLFMHGLLPKGS